MADHYATDEFGYPLTAGERLRRMQGASPSNGEYFRVRGAEAREDTSAPLHFTLREWDEAALDNVTRDMLARIRK